MAELAFYVRAKYDEAIRLREELGKLRTAMMGVDESTEQGKKSMEDLAKKYHETSVALNGIIDTASEAALFMKQGVSDTDKAVLNLIHTIKQGESSIQGVFSATREQMGSVVENLNAAKDVYVRAIEETREKIKELRSLRNQAFSDGNLSDGGAYNTQIDAMEKEIREYERVIKAIDEKNKSTQDEVADIEGAINAYEKQAEAIKETKDLTEEQARSLEKALGDALDLVLGKTQNFQETVKKVANVYKEAKELAERYGSATGKVAEAAMTATKAQTVLHAASLKLGTALVRMGMSATAAKAALALIPGALGVAAISAAIMVITNLIRKHREAKEAAEEARQATIEYYEEVGKGAAPAIEKFEDLRVKYVELRTEMEKKKFIEDNKKALDELGVSVRNVKDADDLLINGVDEYVRAQIRYAEADLKRAQAQEKIAKAASLRMQIEAAEASGETKRVKMTVTNAEAYRMTYGQNADISSLYNPNGTTEVWKEVKVADMLKDELEGLTGEISDLYEDMESTRKAGDQALQSIAEMGPQPLKYEDSLAGKTEKAKAEWEKAKADVKKMRDDAEHYSAEQLAAREADEAKWKKEYEGLAGREATKSGGSSKSGTGRESDKRKTAIESYNKQIQAMIRSVENDIAKEQIAAIDDNSKAIEAQLDLEKQALVEKAEEIGKAMSELFAGNVDLLHRKTIDAAKLAEKGWEDAGEGIATVFSSGYGAYDKGGKMHELLVTPILPNGEVLSPEEVQDYIDNVLDGAADFLAADEKGIVIAVDVDEDGGEKLHEMQEAYYELLHLVEKYDTLKRQSTDKERQEREAESMNAYLRQYGTYEEKKLAITEDYEKRIAKAQTEGDRLALKRQMDSELRDLENSVNQRYHLIFANAEAMSDTILAQAIDATGDAIEKAKNSGNIQELTELYARLREQLSVQRDRSRGWGFAGIIEGFGLRDAAEQKRQTADVLEESLLLKEAGLSIMTKLGLEPEEIVRTRNEINELRAAINALREDATQDDQDALGFLERGFNEVTSVFSQLGSEMSSFRNGERGVLDSIAEMGDALSGLASHAGDIQKAFAGGFTGTNKSQGFAAAISGTIELISMVGKSIANNKKAQEEWNRTIEESEHRYRMLKLDALDYKPSNIFGIEDPFKKATSGAEQYHKAMEGISELTDKLANGKVQTGTKKAVDWGNVGKGAGTGAAAGAVVGSFFGPIGTAIGTAIGAGIGAIAGALSTKVVPVFESLQDHYGQIFDPDTFELNERLLADYDKLDEDTKQIVDHWEEIKKKAEEARKELKDNLKEFTGDLGKKLEDTVVNAWRNHRLYSAVDDYKKYVGQQIASILEQQAFSSVFEGLFNDLGKRMEGSFLGPDADNSIIDDLDDFNQKFPQYLDAYGQLMDQLNAEMQEMGYEGFRERQTNADASTRSFQQISETTGSAIQGGVTALRLSSEVRNEHLSLMSANLDEMLRQQMLSTSIAENIRAIQVDSYLALVAIRDNTANNLATVRGIAETVSSIEKRTRGL